MESKEFNKLSTSEKLRVPTRDLPKPKKSLVFFIIIGIIFLTIISLGTWHDSDKNIVVKEKTGIDTVALRFQAEIMAESAVNAKIKSPASAKYSNENTWYFPDSTVVVRGNVDSQNSFGAMLRSHYFVRMKWNNDFKKDDNWALIDIQFD